MVDISKELNKLLENWLPKLLKAISIDYGMGSAFTIDNSIKQGKNTNMNPLNMTKKDQHVNISIIEDLVKGVNDDMARKINYIINKGVTERWSNEIVAKELKGIFQKNNPNYFNYKNRFKTIARTESTRVMNTSANNTALRLGATKKYLFNLEDKKTGSDSLVSQSKYGKPEQAIPIDKPFKYKYQGKERVFMLPPDRPNDRSIVIYLFD